jgi:peptidoglycan/LPS O-acetylase OafA/YrhL
MNEPRRSEERVRFRTIDGLRGIAALAVVLFHVNVALFQTYGSWVSSDLAALMEHGFLGVDVFFVMSGFVIAYSVRNAQLTLGFIGRFALRRSVRLDPPYWAAMLLEITLIWAGLRLGLAVVPVPSMKQFFSHFLYLQDLLGYGDIINVFWTLCFEIQFFLGLIILLVLHRRISEVFGQSIARPLAAVVLAGLFLYSVLVRYNGFGLEAPRGFAIIRWFQFFMGVCVWWVVSRKIPWYALVAIWMVTLAVVLVQDAPAYELLAIAVSALLWWRYRRDRLTSLLSSRPFQFLGTISYSLYLFHSTVGWRFVRLSSLVLGRDLARFWVWLLFGVAVAVCIAVSWIAWALVERPALRFSRRFSLAPRRSSEGVRAAIDGQANLGPELDTLRP